MVCAGELLSTAIVSAYLNERGIQNKWVDIRDIIRTDDNFRDANIDLGFTQKKIICEHRREQEKLRKNSDSLAPLAETATHERLRDELNGEVDIQRMVRVECDEVTETFAPWHENTSMEIRGELPNRSAGGTIFVVKK